MGKTKYFVDPETNNPQQGFFNSAAQARARKQQGTFTPGRPQTNNLEEVPASVLMQQLNNRIRRTWVVLRFQFHRRTWGLFRHQATLKLGVLFLFGFFLFSGQRDVSLLFSDPIAFLVGESDSKGGHVISASLGQTNFELGGGGSGKSVNWHENAAAPIGVSGVSEEQANDYISRFAKIAQMEMEKFGIPASISLAQGLVESRAGLSTLARRNNNHFGMKCFSKKCRKGHCSNFTDDHHKDFFRIYQNAWESWRAHSEMLASGRYATLRKHGMDYKRWAYGLKSLGYATDKNYAEKLMGMIEKYELYRYDR